MPITIVILIVILLFTLYKYSKLKGRFLQATVLLNAHPLRDFSDIKVGDNFEYHYYDAFDAGWVSWMAQLISLPNGKFQLVKIDDNNKVIGATRMGIKDSLEEVQEYLRNTRIVRLP